MIPYTREFFFLDKIIVTGIRRVLTHHLRSIPLDDLDAIVAYLLNEAGQKPAAGYHSLVYIEL